MPSTASAIFGSSPTKPSRYAVVDEADEADQSDSDRDHVSDAELEDEDQDVSIEDDYDEDERYPQSLTHTSHRRNMHRSASGNNHEAFVLYAVSVIRNVASLEKDYGATSVSLTGYNLKVGGGGGDHHQPHATAAELLDGIFAASPNRKGMYASPAKHTPHRRGATTAGASSAEPKNPPTDRASKTTQMLRELALSEQEAATVMKDLRVAITNERAKAAAVIRRLQGRMNGFDADADVDEGDDNDDEGEQLGRRRSKRDEDIAAAMVDVTAEANRPLFVSLAGKALLEDGVVPLIASCTSHLQQCGEEVASASAKVERLLRDMWDHQHTRKALKREMKEMRHHRHLLETSLREHQPGTTASSQLQGDTQLLMSQNAGGGGFGGSQSGESIEEIAALRDELDNALFTRAQEIQEEQTIINRLSASVTTSRSGLAFLVRRDATLKKLVLYAIKLLCAVTLPVPPQSPNVAIQIDIMTSIRDFLTSDHLFQRLVSLTAPLAGKRLGDEQELERSKQQLRKARKEELRAERRAALGIAAAHIKETSRPSSPFKTPKKNNPALRADQAEEEEDLYQRSVSENQSEDLSESDDDGDDLIDAEMAAEIDNEAVLASSVADPLPKEEGSLIEMTLLLVGHLLKGPGSHISERLLSVLCRCHMTDLLLVVLHQNHYLSTVVVEALRWKESRSRSRSKSAVSTTSRRRAASLLGAAGRAPSGSRAPSQALSHASSAGVSSVGRRTILGGTDIKAEDEDRALSEMAARGLDFESSNPLPATMPYPEEGGGLGGDIIAAETYQATLDVRLPESGATAEEVVIDDDGGYSPTMLVVESAALFPRPEEIEKEEGDGGSSDPHPSHIPSSPPLPLGGTSITGETQLVLVEGGSDLAEFGGASSCDGAILQSRTGGDADEAGEDDLIMGDDLGDLDFNAVVAVREETADAESETGSLQYDPVSKVEEGSRQPASIPESVQEAFQEVEKRQRSVEAEDESDDDDDEEVMDLTPTSQVPPHHRSRSRDNGTDRLLPLEDTRRDILLAMNPDAIRNHIRETGIQVKRWNFLVLEAMALMVSRGSSGSGSEGTGVTTAAASPLVGEMARLSLQQVSGTQVASVLSAASALVSSIEACTHSSHTGALSPRRGGPASVSDSLAAASNVASLSSSNASSPYSVLMMRKDMEDNEWRRLAKARHGATAASSAILVRHSRGVGPGGVANGPMRKEVIGQALTLAPALVKGSTQNSNAPPADGRVVHDFEAVEVVQQDLTSALSVASIIDGAKKRMFAKKTLLAESAMRIGGKSQVSSWHNTNTGDNLKLGTLFPSVLPTSRQPAADSRAIAADRLQSLLASLADSTASSSSAIATSTTLPVKTILSLSKMFHQFVDAGFELISTMLWPELRNTLEHLQEACEEQRERTNEIRQMRAQVRASGGGEAELEEMIEAHRIEQEEQGRTAGMSEVAAFLQSATTGTQVSDLMMYFSLCSNLLFFARETLEHVETAMVRLQITLAECLRECLALDEVEAERKESVNQMDTFDELLFGGTTNKTAAPATTTASTAATSAETTQVKIRLFPADSRLPGVVHPSDPFTTAVPGTFIDDSSPSPMYAMDRFQPRDYLTAQERSRREELEGNRVRLEESISELQGTMKALYEQQWRSIAHLINDDHIDKGLHLLAAFRESEFLRKQFDMSVVVTFLSGVLKVLVGLLGEPVSSAVDTSSQTDMFEDTYFSSTTLARTAQSFLSGDADAMFDHNRHIHHRDPAVATAAHALASKILFSEENIKLILAVISGDGVEGRVTRKRGGGADEEPKDRNTNVNFLGAVPLETQVGLSMAGGAPHITSSYTLLLDATLQMLERISMDGYVALDGSTARKGKGRKRTGKAEEEGDGDDLAKIDEEENSSEEDGDDADLRDFIDDSEEQAQRMRRQARRRQKEGAANIISESTTQKTLDDVQPKLFDQNDNDALVEAHLREVDALMGVGIVEAATEEEGGDPLLRGATEAQVGSTNSPTSSGPVTSQSAEENTDGFLSKPGGTAEADDYIDYSDDYGGHAASATSSFRKRALVEYYLELGSNNRYLPLLLHTLRQWRRNSPAVNTSLTRILRKILEGNATFGSTNLFCAPMLLAMRDVIKALAPSFANPVAAAVHLPPLETGSAPTVTISTLEAKRQEFAVRLRCDSYIRAHKALYDVCDETVFQFFNPVVFFLGSDTNSFENTALRVVNTTASTTTADDEADPSMNAVTLPGVTEHTVTLPLVESADDAFFSALKANEEQALGDASGDEPENVAPTTTTTTATTAPLTAVVEPPLATKAFRDPDSFLRFEVALRCVRSLFNAAAGDAVADTMHDDTLRLFAFETYSTMALMEGRAAEEAAGTDSSKFVPHGLESKRGLEEDAYQLYQSILLSPTKANQHSTRPTVAAIIASKFNQLSTAPEIVTATTTATRQKRAGNKRTREEGVTNDEDGEIQPAGYALDMVGIRRQNRRIAAAGTAGHGGSASDNEEEDREEEQLGGQLKSAIRSAVKRKAPKGQSKSKHKSKPNSTDNRPDAEADLSQLDKAARKALKAEKKLLREERKHEKQQRKAEKQAAKKMRRAARHGLNEGAPHSSPDNADSSNHGSSEDDDAIPPPARKSGMPVTQAESDFKEYHDNNNDDDDLLLEIEDAQDDGERRFSVVGAGVPAQTGLANLRSMPRPTTQDMVELEVED